MMKQRNLTVTVEEIDDGLAQGWKIAITNGRGRRWYQKGIEGCPGNAAEHAAILQEVLDDGNTLDPSYWEEDTGRVDPYVHM